MGSKKAGHIFLTIDSGNIIHYLLAIFDFRAHWFFDKKAGYCSGVTVCF
ncbi:MAG: hypothetical protein GY849_13545 [Deltaproteobacteria bacterium]|nr:hypothetical protein [Deltaproteobacteria bacterium]